MKLRMLVLNYEYPPLGGGAGNHTRYLLREFSKDPSLTIDLITSSTGTFRMDPLGERITGHFLDIRKRSGLHYQTNRDLLTYAVKALLYARNLQRKHPYDVVLAYFGIPCGVIAWRLKVPYVVSLQGSDVPFYSERFRHLDRLLFKRLSQKVWRESAFTIANSHGLRDLALQSARDQPIGVIFNGIDIEEFHSRPTKEPDGSLHVLCVSRLIARKGLEYLLDAMQMLKDAEVTLTIAGRGNQEEALRQRATELGITEKVRFPGFVAHEDLPTLYREADAFVLPSLNEGMSNTVLEAIASGLPVLLTDTGGTAELLEAGANGFLIEKKSARSIATALRRYLTEPTLLARHGAKSRQIAETLSWANVAAQYKELFLKAAGTVSAPSGKN